MQNSCQLFALYNFFFYIQTHIHTCKMFTILIHQHDILTSAKHSHAILRLTRLYNMDAVAKDMPFSNQPKIYNYMTSLFVHFLFFKGAPQYEGSKFIHVCICIYVCVFNSRSIQCLYKWVRLNDRRVRALMYNNQPTNICTNIYMVIKHTRPFPFLFFLFLYHSQSISVVSVCIQPR